MELHKIKFKAKRLDNGEWIEGLPCENCDKQSCILVLYSKEGGEYGFIPVDPLTICQFTGLKDKNGKEIWEHDLISFHEKGELCEVIFEKGRFMALNSDNIPTAIITGIEHYDRDILVLGNKFDRKKMT